MFKTWLTSVPQPILGLGKGRYIEKEGSGELHGIPKVVFSSHFAVESSRDCEKVVCTCLIHLSYDRSTDVSSNRTRGNDSSFTESMVLGLEMAWEPMSIALPL